AWASQPGHPLDCSDWVFLQSGYSCTMLPSGSDNFTKGANKVIDNEGAIITLDARNAFPSNSPGSMSLVRHQTSGDTQLIGYIEDRPVPACDHIRGVAPQATCRSEERRGGRAWR